MSEQGPPDLDTVFKALGNEKRRRILRLLAQRDRYPYELHKVLELTPRGVLKHLEILQEAGLVEREHGESDLGPDRVYYKLSPRFGLSTTILPDTFFVRLTRGQAGGRILVPRGFVIPEARPDVAAIRQLLQQLGKVDRRLRDIDDERMKYTSLRGKITRRIEDIMEQSHWDEESRQRIRALLDPNQHQRVDSRKTSEVWAETVREAIQMFESLFAQMQTVEEPAESDDEEIVVDPE
jgi:predicted transcriptional regulator